MNFIWRKTGTEIICNEQQKTEKQNPDRILNILHMHR